MSEFILKNKRLLNTLELSDVFRRASRTFDDEAQAKKITALTRNIVSLITHYRLETPDLPENREVDLAITKEVVKLARTAKSLGVEKVVLPIKKHQSNPCAQRLQSHVLSSLNLPVKVELYTGLYHKDCRKAFGRVDGRRKTALDKDLRGIITPAVHPVLLVKWKL